MLLQLPILLLRQQLDAHFGSHLQSTVLGFVLLPGIQRFLIVTDASAPTRALRGAIAERDAPRFVVANHVGFAAARFHGTERLHCIEIAFQFGLNRGPCDASVAMHVLLEARLQYFNQLVTLWWLHVPVVRRPVSAATQPPPHAPAASIGS